MKKLLEAELVSIAHRILKLKGREDIDALLKEAQLVTQKLTVLKFYEDYKYMVEKDMPQEDFDKEIINFSIKSNSDEPTIQVLVSDELKKMSIEKTLLFEELITEATIPTADEVPMQGDTNFFEIDVEPKSDSLFLEDQKETFLDDGQVVNELINTDLTDENEIVVSENEVADTITEKGSKLNKKLAADEKLDLPVDKQNEVADEILTYCDEKTKDSHFIAVENEEISSQIVEQKLEDLFQDFSDLEFVKAEENKENFPEESLLETSDIEINSIPTEIEKVDDLTDTSEALLNYEESIYKQTENVLKIKPFSLNDKLIGSVKIGLNDKIGFVKHLFGGSEEDFTRVVSQLNTFNSHQEAIDFVENIVKPDYNNWKNKEDYATRLFGILERSY